MTTSVIISPPENNAILDRERLRDLGKSCGADAIGFTEATRQELGADREAIMDLLPGAKSVAAIMVRLNQDAIGSSWMSIANCEMGNMTKRLDSATADLSRKLRELGIRSVAIPASFPMEAHKWPEKMWAVSHKTIAEQAGLGSIGHNRLLIHPEFGAGVLLGTVIFDRSLNAYDAPLSQSPCNGCKLCVAACPTGSIRPDGRFNFINCSTHTYRYRLGGFIDWVETIAQSGSARKYRERIPDQETISTWQALTYQTEYTCLNCIAICPIGRPPAVSGKDSDKEPGSRGLLRRLQSRGETVFVLKGSDAEAHVRKNYPEKSIHQVGRGVRTQNPGSFLPALPLVFQPEQSEGLDAVFHFQFTGKSSAQGTVTISNKHLSISHELEGAPDVQVSGDGNVWLDCTAGERSLLWALVTRKIRIQGKIGLLKDFARCFPK